MIKEFTLHKEKEIYNLIRSVFDEYVAPDCTDAGCKTFYDYIAPIELINRHREGNILLTYEENNQITGAIEVRDSNHICLFFVRKDFHNRGIGKTLFNAVLEKVREKTDFIEVNASPFSEKIYAQLGFKKTDELTEKNGITYIPMQILL